MKKEIIYLVVETRPKNKSEFKQLGEGVRIELLRKSLDETKFILPWDKSNPRPSFLDEAKTKEYTENEIFKEINKVNSEWQEPWNDPLDGAKNLPDFRQFDGGGNIIVDNRKLK